MLIFVTTVNGKTTTLEVESRYGTDNVSTWTQDKEEIPLESQCTAFFSEMSFCGFQVVHTAEVCDWEEDLIRGGELQRHRQCEDQVRRQ